MVNGVKRLCGARIDGDSVCVVGVENGDDNELGRDFNRYFSKLSAISRMERMGKLSIIATLRDNACSRLIDALL